MGDIHFKCTDCGQKIVTDATGAGQQTACPTCGTAIAVPPPDEARSQPAVGLSTHTQHPSQKSQVRPPPHSKGRFQDTLRYAWRGAMHWGSMGLMIGAFLGWPAIKAWFANQDPNAATAFTLQAGGTALAGAIIGALIGLLRSLGAAVTGTLGHPEESELPALIERSSSQIDEERLGAVLQLYRLVDAHKVTDNNSQRLAVRAFAQSLKHFGLKNHKLAAGLAEALATPDLYTDPATHKEILPALPVLLDMQKANLSDLGTNDTMGVILNVKAVIDRAFPSQSSHPDVVKSAEPTLVGAEGLEELVQELTPRLAGDGDRVTVSRILANVGPKAAPATELLVRCLSDKTLETAGAINCAIALGRIGPAALPALPALTAVVSSKPTAWKFLAGDRCSTLKPYAEKAIAQISVPA